MRTNRRKLIAGSSALAASAALTKGLGKASAQDSVKVRWWHIVTDETNKGILQGVADQFAADNPGVTVEITVLENEAFKAKLATAMQGGDPPDIFQSWGGGVLYQYAEAGLVQDITADLAADGWGATFQPGALGLYANRRQKLRCALGRRHGRLLVQQGALHQSRHRQRPHHLGRAS